MNYSAEINLSELAGRPLTAEQRLQIGYALATAIGNRIRISSQAADGSRLDPNDPDYEAQKRAAGGYPQPLVDTGAMTEPGAFDVRATETGVILELRAEHREKWDRIHRIAESTGKNWDEAWAIGPDEWEVIYAALDRFFS